MSIKEFCKKYNVKEDDFKKSELTIEFLTQIENDYKGRIATMDDVANSLVRVLLKFNSVHSVRYRIKDSTHLVNKIIRYKLLSDPVIVTLDNYLNEINDLIGLRVIHLFKSNWIDVNKDIEHTWKLHSKIANYRTGDPDDIINLYRDNGCELKERDAGYRSVHYIISTQMTRTVYKAEIQVRTIFEEGWGEIDHKLRYPNDLDNALLNEFLKILNRLAGSADEMGEFVLRLKADMEFKEDLQREKDNELKLLREQIEKSKLNAAEKKSLNSNVDKLESIKKVERVSFKTSNNPKLSEMIKKYSDDTFIKKGVFKPMTINALNEILKELDKDLTKGQDLI